MNIKGVRINIVLLVVMAALILFFAGQHLLKIYNVEQPLVNKLEILEGVEAVQLIDNNGKIDIQLSLNKDDIDFYDIYQQSDRIAMEQLGTKKGIIKVKNTDNKVLNEIYYKIHYAIYEGIATRRFTEMEKRVGRIAEENNLNYKLWVDNENVYVQITDKTSSLYQIIPRTDKVVFNVQGGGNDG